MYKKIILPITPTVKPIETSYGYITIRPITSQANRNKAPIKAVCQRPRFKLSPKYIDTTLGTINPINGIYPTVIIITDVIRAIIVNPTFTTHL